VIKTAGPRPPAVLLLPATIAVLFLTLPIAGLLLRAPWSDLAADVRSSAVTEALRLSLVCSLASALLSVVLGVPLAWVLARVAFPGRSLVRGIATLPLVLPPVVGGVALLLALGRLGLVGRWLDSAFGLTFFGTSAGVVIAETFVAMPFLVLTVEAALRAQGRRLEQAAAGLGAGPLTTFRRITLPAIAPAITAGALLAWARALGEFGATITFAGDLPGSTQTVPLAVYIELQHDVGGAIALSLVLVAVSLTVLILLRGRWWPAG
jgi:molybdate transport system permease protein